MKIREITENILNIVIRADKSAEPAAPADHDYGNSPGEKYLGIETTMRAGDDVHKSKNPSDMRTNAPSLYPGHQHQPKD